MQTLGTAETLERQTQTLEIPQGLGLGFGDFVWGRIKNYQWWPGRVHDPSKVSDDAIRGHQTDRDAVLVSYFGSDTFAWCNPSQLMPFVECFDQIVSSSSSKSFRAALGLALSELSRCLQAQLSCDCFPEEGSGGFGKISNYSAEEFLGLLRAVAVHTSEVNALEVAMLRGWVVGFERGIDVGHMRKAVSDLVDKIDLDIPAVEVIEGEEENEGGLFTRSGAFKVPDRRRKKRSMAVLIAQMDLDSVEVSDGEEEKEEIEKDLDSVSDEEEIGKDLEVEIANGGSGVKAEEVGSGRRERKKSKYLSPPYTHLSGGAVAKSLASPKSPKSPRALPLEHSSIVVKCTPEGLHEEEKDKCRPLFEVDGLDTRELLMEFCATAANPFHLKRNRLAKTVTGFFAEFKKSVNPNGANFDAYEKQLVESVGRDGKIVNIMVDNEFEDGRKTDGRRGRKRNHAVNAEGESLVGKSGEGKKTEEKRGRKKKDVVNGERETLGNKSEDGKKSERKRGRKRKDVVNGEGETLGDRSDDGKQPERRSGRKRNYLAFSEGGTLDVESEDGEIPQRKKGRKRKDVANEGETPVDKSVDDKKTVGRRGRKKNDEVYTEGETSAGQASKHLEKNDEASDDGNSAGKMGRKKADANQNNAGELCCKTVINVELKETKGELANTKSTKKATLKRKRKNTKGGPIIDVPVNLGSEITQGSDGGMSRMKKSSKKSTGNEDPAALLLTFSAETSLPSKEYLVSAFSTYGPVIQSGTELVKESNGAKVVFERSSDAEKAFNDKIVALGLPVASCRLRYLTGNLSLPSSPTPVRVQKPPLPSIRKSLVKMISSLSGSTLESRENLVGDMHGLLMKVDKLMSEPAAGNST